MIAGIAERAVIFGLVAAVGFAGGWKVNGWRLGEGIAQEALQTATVVRVVERAQQTVADTEGKNGHAEIDQARAYAAAAAATATGLRAEAGKLATRLATCNAGTAAERQARADAARVFAEVLASMEAAGRAMAEIAERARAAGGTCERTYDGIRAIGQ
jgi:Ni,Fe-hydrogenase I large subunit